MRWFTRQPLIVKLLTTALACAAVIAGPVRSYVNAGRAIDPTNYELAIQSYGFSVLASILALAAATIWHLIAKRHHERASSSVTWVD